MADRMCHVVNGVRGRVGYRTGGMRDRVSCRTGGMFNRMHGRAGRMFYGVDDGFRRRGYCFYD